MTRWPDRLSAQPETDWNFIGRAVGNTGWRDSRSSHGRMSISTGAPGRPMIRDNCVTEISDGDGTESTSSSRVWTRYLAAASRGHRGEPQKPMTYRNSGKVNLEGFVRGQLRFRRQLNVAIRRCSLERRRVRDVRNAPFFTILGGRQPDVGRPAPPARELLIRVTTPSHRRFSAAG